MHLLRNFYKELSLKPQGFTMIVASFLPVFAIVAMFPIVALIIDHFRTIPNAAIKVPAMVTAPGYAIALLAPFAGLATDRFGRRRLLLICTFFYGIIGTAPFLLESIDTIIASRILLGVCEAGILTVVNTLIADYWDDGGRRNWLMLQGFVVPLINPLVFLLVAAVAAVRWNAGFLVYAIAFPVFVAMVLWAFEPKRPAPQLDPSEAGRFPMASALLVCTVTLLTALLYFVFVVNGSIAWREIGVTDPMEVSKATFGPSLFVVVGALLFRLVSRYTNAVQIALFLCLLGFGLAGIGMARTVTEMQAALMIHQTGAGMTVPSLIAWAQSKFAFAHRGRGMGLWTSAFFLGQALSPIVVGNLAAGSGSMKLAFVQAGMAGLVACAGVLLLSMISEGWGLRRGWR
mgnify:CR=1 FL=1